MMQLIVGRAGSGKTRAIVDVVRSRLRSRAAGAVWVIQPNAAAVAGFRRELLTTAGARDGDAAAAPTALTGVTVGTFTTLALRVFDLAGRPRPQLLSPAMRSVLVGRALQRVVAGRPAFAAYAERTGFRRLLGEFVGETMRNGITPAALAAARERIGGPRRRHETGLPAAEDKGDDDGSADLCARLDLLTDLLHHFESAADAAGVVDAGRLPRLAAGLARDRRTGVGQALGLVAFDNFSRFTDCEAELLTVLARRADAAHGTLCTTDPEAGRRMPGQAPPRAFAYLRQTWLGLTEAAGAENAAWSMRARNRPRRFRSGSLAHLEAELFRSDVLPGAGGEPGAGVARVTRLQQAGEALQRDRSIQLIRPADVPNEVEAVVGEIRRLHTVDGVPLERIAVLHRDAATYDDLFAEGLRRAQIPAQIPRSVALRETALWWLIEALVATAASDSVAPAEPARRLLTNPLFAPDVTAEVLEAIRICGLVTVGDCLDESAYARGRSRFEAAATHAGRVAAVVDRLAGVMRETATELAAAGPHDAVAPALSALVTALLAAVDDLAPAPNPADAGGGTALPGAARLDPAEAAHLRERIEARNALGGLLAEWLTVTRTAPDAAIADPGTSPTGGLFRAGGAPPQPTPAQPADAAGVTIDGDGVDDPFAAVLQLWRGVIEAAGATRLRVDPAAPTRGVVVGDVLVSRLPSAIDVMIVVGLNQGVFPPPPSTDAVLPDADRRRISLTGAAWFEPRAELRAHEDFQFYVAATRASHRLILSVPRRTANGKDALPSPYVRDVAAAFNLSTDDLPRLRAGAGADADGRRSRLDPADAELIDGWLADPTQPTTDPIADAPGRDDRFDALLAARRDSPDHPPVPWLRLHTPDSLVRWAVRTLWRRRPVSVDALAGWHAAAAVWDRRHADHPDLPAAVRAGFADPLAAVISDDCAARYRARNRALSASGINTFVNCPYRFFAQYHLDLQEPEQAEPTVATWGSLHHLVLEELGRKRRHGTITPDTAPDWAVERLAHHAQTNPELGFPRLLRQERFQAELRLQQEKLRAFVRHDANRWSRRPTEPLGFEAAFGFGDADDADTSASDAGTDDGEFARLPDEPVSPEPLTLTDPDDPDSAVRIRGYIDLVEISHDRRGRPWASVIDYKSGSIWHYHKKLRGLETDAAVGQLSAPADRERTDDAGSVDFQLPIYLLAAQRLFGIEPLGAFFYSLAKRSKRGIYRDDRDELLPLSEINDRDQRSPRTLKNFMARAERVLPAVGKRIDSGEITIAPHDCMFCPFTDLCRFDKTENDARRSRRKTSGGSA
jgi:ATP-dependent helicase/DNAse subunit B